MIKLDAITRINLALDRIEHALNVYAAMAEFIVRGRKLDA
jgi:hypothetical protein